MGGCLEAVSGGRSVQTVRFGEQRLGLGFLKRENIARALPFSIKQLLNG